METAAPHWWHDFAALLKAALEERGWSQRDLAGELQRQHPLKGGEEDWRTEINAWANTRKAPPGPTRARYLAEVFGKPTDFFVTQRPNETRAALRARIRELEAQLARQEAPPRR